MNFRLWNLSFGRGETPATGGSRPLLVRSLRQGREQVRRAFTLVEVIATIVVLAVVGSIASRTVLTATDGYMKAATQAQLHSELSIALDRIMRELREMPIKTSYASIAPDIASVSSTAITWRTNYSLTLSGSQLMFVENGSASSILLENVTAFSITTYNESNAALSSSLSGAGCDPIRRIAVQITVQRSGITESLSAKVFIRSTMKGAISS